MVATLLAATAFEAAAADCPQPDKRLFDAEQDVISFYLQDAANYATEAVASFGCSDKAQPPQVARLFLVHGMIRFLQDDMAGAERAFWSAKQLQPTTWQEDYGPKARALYESASLAGSASPASVSMKGFGAGDWLTVNGLEATPPLQLPPGMHLLQVGSGDIARFARILDIQPGTDLIVSVQSGERVEVAPAGEVTIVDEARRDEDYESRRAQYIALKLVLDNDARGVRLGSSDSADWQIRDGHGRSLKARQFATLVGDKDRARRLQANYTLGLATSGTLYGIGLPSMFIGLIVLPVELALTGRAGAGGVLLLGGTIATGAATVPAVLVLGRQDVRHHYSQAEAEEKLEAYNQEMRAHLGVEREARLQLRPVVGPGGLGFRGVF